VSIAPALLSLYTIPRKGAIFAIYLFLAGKTRGIDASKDLFYITAAVLMSIHFAG
jgi:hypothetical protein